MVLLLIVKYCTRLEISKIFFNLGQVGGIRRKYKTAELWVNALITNKIEYCDYILLVTRQYLYR